MCQSGCNNYIVLTIHFYIMFYVLWCRRSKIHCYVAAPLIPTCICLADIKESVTYLGSGYLILCWNSKLNSLFLVRCLQGNDYLNKLFSSVRCHIWVYRVFLVLYLETLLRRFKQFKQGYKSGRQSQRSRNAFHVDIECAFGNKNYLLHRKFTKLVI
jgi:hypothetical protein